MFRRTKEGSKWVVPRSSRFNIVKLCHDDQGHFGDDKTLEKVRENYWFKGMRRFVKKYVNACLNCLYYKQTSGRKPGYMHPIEKVAIPFHTIHIDHVGPFIKSQQKNTHILNMVDGFTKFCVLESVRDTRTKWVIRALDQLFTLFGVPNRIVSDRGPCFTSQRFADFCQEYNIKHVLNATATPRANGQVERVNATVVRALATTSAGDDEDNWDLYVKKVQSAINTTTNRTTRQCPSRLLYGYKPKSTASSALLTTIQDTLDSIDLTGVREAAKDATDQEQERQKARFDAKRAKPPKYAVGDVVLVAAEPPATGTSKKLTAKAKGPFRVTAVLPHDRYEVEDLRDLQKRRGKRGVVAVDSMRKWVSFNALE